MFSLPPVTQALIVANVAVFFLDSLVGRAISMHFALWPIGPQFEPWQIFSYAFLLGGLSHLLFNMYGLFLFGGDVERVWETHRYLSFYLFCAVFAGIVQLIVSTVSGAYYPTVGASGALFGVLLAFARCFPSRVIMPLFPPILMRAPVFVMVYGALELFLGVTGTQSGIAHFAHLGGLAGSFLFLRFNRRWR